MPPSSGTGRIDFADFVDAVASGLHPLHVSLPLEAAAPYEALLTTTPYEATSRGGAPPHEFLHARAPSYFHAPAYVEEYPDHWKWDVPLPPSIPVDPFAERPHAWIGGRSVEIPEMNPEMKMNRDARPWHAWPSLPEPYSENDPPSPLPPNPPKPSAMLPKPKAYYIEPPSMLPPKLPPQHQHQRQHQQFQAPAMRPPPLPPPPPLRPLRGEAAVRQELRRRERERLLLQLERRRAERSEVEHELDNLRREHEELRTQMHEEARRKRLGAFQASQASQPDPTRSATPALNKLRAALPGSADAAVSAASAANARGGGARGPAANLAAAPPKGGAAKPAVAKGMAAKGATAPGSPKNARPKTPTKREKVNSLAAANKLL